VTGNQVLTWLDARRPAPPATLRARLAQIVGGTAPRSMSFRAPLPAYLAELGRALLDGVAARPGGGRELALDLLAADAFVTYAFEAQAEADVGGVAPLAEGIAQ
jgi:hypothetical protein